MSDKSGYVGRESAEPADRREEGRYPYRFRFENGQEVRQAETLHMIVPARGGRRIRRRLFAGQRGKMPERKRTWNSRKKMSLKRWA